MNLLSHSQFREIKVHISLEERRSQSRSPSPWLGAVLDELDVGVLVVDVRAQLRHANRRARQELTADHPLLLEGGQLKARAAADACNLQMALEAASKSDKRRLLTLEADGEAWSVAVLPVPSEPELAMLVLGRRRLGDRCTLQWFASHHGLTPSEQRVMEALAEGHKPDEIAEHLSVGIATVRSHIGSLRAKVGAPSIRALLHRMAALPPMAQRLPN
jgi:DNA-binding CsgD family transcriptional regulator